MSEPAEVSPLESAGDDRATEDGRAPIDSVIRRRRTSLRMDPDRLVERATLTELCSLASTAPNHHSTRPWRFAIFTGDGRSELGDTIAAAMERSAGDAPTVRIEKTRTKYRRAPAMIVVGVAPGASRVEDLENRDAVAAAVQTLLLAATGRGLASFWSSVATPDDPALSALCGFEPGSTAIAAIYIGHPTDVAESRPRTEPSIRWIDRGA